MHRGEKQRLELKVVPRASRNEITGWLGGRLKVRVAAVPERGRANEALEGLLADALQLPRHAVRVVAGASTSRKLVEISGLTRAELLRRLPERR